MKFQEISNIFSSCRHPVITISLHIETKQSKNGNKNDVWPCCDIFTTVQHQIQTLTEDARSWLPL